MIRKILASLLVATLVITFISMIAWGFVLLTYYVGIFIIPILLILLLTKIIYSGQRKR
jgi:hypothetical protein